MNSDWNKWMVIYNFNSDGTEYLSQKQHDLFTEAVLAKDESVVLKDGRILPVRGARVRLNPDYVDPEKVEKIRELVKKQREKTEEKYG